MTYEHPVYTRESVAAQAFAARPRDRPDGVRRRLPRVGVPRGRLRVRRAGRRRVRGDLVTHLRHAARARPAAGAAPAVRAPAAAVAGRPRRPARSAAAWRSARRDHLGGPDRPIRANLTSWLADQGVPAPARVMMLAAPRSFGYVFNPLTRVLVPRRGRRAGVRGGRGAQHLRRAALLPAAPGRAVGAPRRAKEFYVSPFLEVGGHYRMRLPPPDERLSLSVALLQEGRPAFTATRRRSPRRRRDPGRACSGTRSPCCRTGCGS